MALPPRSPQGRLDAPPPAAQNRSGLQRERSKTQEPAQAWDAAARGDGAPKGPVPTALEPSLARRARALHGSPERYKHKTQYFAALPVTL